MVKVIRVPLTDRYNRDFMTGKVVEMPPIEQSINQQEKVAKWLKMKQEEAVKLGRNDWKIYVDWLGWVSL